MGFCEDPRDEVQQRLACSRFLIRVREDAVTIRMVVVTASIPQARRSALPSDSPWER